MPVQPKADWEAIEREYRAGQLSLREIGRLYSVSDTAVRKRARAGGWERDLTAQVQKEVRAQLVRDDSSQAGSQEQRATDREIVQSGGLRGVEVIRSHRKSLAQLNAIGDILAERLAQILDGVTPDGPALGDKESPGDLLEKLSRVRQRTVQLERQAFNLDSQPDGETDHRTPLERVLDRAAEKERQEATPA